MGLSTMLHSKRWKRWLMPICPGAGGTCWEGSPVPGGGLGPPAGGAGLLCPLRGGKQPELPLPCSKGPQSDTGGHPRLRAVPGSAAASAPSLLGGCAGGSPSPGLLQPSPPLPPGCPSPALKLRGKAIPHFLEERNPLFKHPLCTCGGCTAP